MAQLRANVTYLAAAVAVVLALIAGVGVAAAAVSGDFTATYDGYNDGESTDRRGHEIAIQGQLDVTGDAAVNPRIVVKGTDNTVVDTETARIFVEGDQSIQFDEQYGPSQVAFTADEIPAGTTLRIEFVAYYVGGADSKEMPVSTVNFNFDQPGGDRTREQFTVRTTLENRPEEAINSASTGSQLSQIQVILSYIGGASIIIAILILAVKAIGDDNPPGGGGPGPN